VFFEDEATVQLTPTLCGQWALKGIQPLIPSLARMNQKIHLFGAINAVSGKAHHRKAPTISSLYFIRFAAHLLNQYPRGRVILILDNAVWHKSCSFKLFQKKYPRLILFFLPPYSPDMNPAESLWKNLRREVTHNYFFEKLSLLGKAITLFFAKKQSRTAHKQLKAWCNIC